MYVCMYVGVGAIGFVHFFADSKLSIGDVCVSRPVGSG